MGIEIIFDIILILIGLYLALFKSYFNEKGKNIATSDDIIEVIHKVELVKQNFIGTNASLKAKLDLITNSQINHKSDERNSLIDFHKKIKSWIGLLTESSPSLIDDYDNKEIQNKLFQYDLQYQKVLGAEALLELYIDDKNLIKSISDLKLNVLKHLVPYPPKFLLNLKQNNFEFEQYEKMPVETSENIEKKSKKHGELLKHRKAIFEEYRVNMIKGFNEIKDFDIDYRKKMKQYILKISDE